MKRDQKQNPEGKKGFPGLLLLFIIGLVVILAFQNLSETRMANVSFSHQIEHLVNLDLLDDGQNRQTSINDNLVSFSGKFKDTLSESAKNRYRFIRSLNQHHVLNDLHAKLTTELNTLFQEAHSSVQFYLQISSTSVPLGGYVVVPKSFNTGESSNHIVIKELGLSSASLVTIKHVKEKFAALSGGDRSAEKLASLGTSLQTLVAEFRSDQLSIGSENLKKSLAQTHKRLDEIENDTSMNYSEKLAAYKTAFKEVESVSAQIASSTNGVKCYNLRYVRNYAEKIEQVRVTNLESRKNAMKLAKAKASVSSVIWFYNNNEISTNGLSKVPSEEYQRWFVHADKEWKAFETNMGLPFKAPDQPRTAPLENTFRTEEPAPNYFSYLFTFMPILLVGLLLYFIFSRQAKGGGSSAMSFGKSPAKLLHKSTQKTTFDDVMGIHEAKEELEEVVEFLKYSSRFTKLGARIPKGVLLVGPPGTGKTLLARAVAGEAGVPFFSISGSDFVEMFVGVGASRVRDLFEQARKSAPCIIFIDEIDAVGRHRGSGMGGGHDEREQTLNQLLVEFDGMDSKEGIIIIAATNRYDVLDPALLRPGRFDRSVTVDLPDFRGRVEILMVHARKVKMDKSVDLKQVAARTAGKAGADLESIINEAAIYAGRKNRQAIIQEDMIYALEKVQFGKERRSLVLTKEDLEITAWHEAGHTVIALILQTDDDVTVVTIIPRGQSLGATHFQEKRNRVSYRRSELIKKLACLMGGRVAEEIHNKDPTNGAAMDIRMATSYAKAMVVEWGMSKDIGMVSYSDDSQKNIMAGFSEKAHSDETALKIDQEIKKLLDEAYEKAHEILDEHYDKMKKIAEMLLMFETLDRKDLSHIMDGKFDPTEKQNRIDEIASSRRRDIPPVPQKFLKKKKLIPKPT